MVHISSVMDFVLAVAKLNADASPSQTENSAQQNPENRKSGYK
jgi:hypothetical protein